jgi:phage major head subunit gpT-like protein
MSIDAKVSIFTTTMRTEFNTAYYATAEPAPWQTFTQIIPSTARIEHYTWMSPTPGVARYTGHRRYGKISTIRYSVENLEFDSSFEVLRRDVEDDQTGGYGLKSAELGERARKFPGRWAIQHLAAGASRPCFDDSMFFADAHIIGTGDNKLAGTGTGTAGTYKMAALFTGARLKPLLWQQRKAPDFRTDAGSPEADKAKIMRYWIDMEGEAAYGYWWDAVLYTWTGLPTVVEFQTGLGEITAAFRSFFLPKALESDDGEFIHEQEVFSQGNLTIVGATALERIAAQALNEDWIPQNIGSNTVATTNLYKGFANFIPSAFMN